LNSTLIEDVSFFVTHDRQTAISQRIHMGVKIEIKSLPSQPPKLFAGFFRWQLGRFHILQYVSIAQQNPIDSLERRKCHIRFAVMLTSTAIVTK